MAPHWPERWPNIVDPDELHIFDPVGNLLLQLKRKPLAEASIVEEPPLVPDELEELADTEDLISGVTSLPEPLSEQAGEDVVIEEISQLGLEDQVALDGTPSVYLRVSARHLVLASSIFKAMLEPDKFKEGNLLRSQGNLIVNLPDDPEALITLMHVIHGATRKVPRSITLDTLASLATLVDYYKLHEAVELFSDTWVKNLNEKAFPKNYNSDVVPWLFISWVFQIEDAFMKITQILICEGDDTAMDAIEHENIPIPPILSDKIQEHRNEAIEGIITVIYDYIAKHLTPDILCSDGGDFACDAQVLGSLLKSSLTIGIWPRPAIPYRGITFSRLATQTREMQISDECAYRNGYSYGRGCGHGIKDTINASIKSLEDQYPGLKLAFALATQGGKKDKKDKKGKRKGGVGKRKKKGKYADLWEL